MWIRETYGEIEENTRIKQEQSKNKARTKENTRVILKYEERDEEREEHEERNEEHEEHKYIQWRSQRKQWDLH